MIGVLKSYQNEYIWFLFFNGINFFDSVCLYHDELYFELLQITYSFNKELGYAVN